MEARILPSISCRCTLDFSYPSIIWHVVAETEADQGNQSKERGAEDRRKSMARLSNRARLPSAN